MAWLSGCSVVAKSDFPFIVPNPPENSSHGYQTEDDRIPRLATCADWHGFWPHGGPAVSFDVASAQAQPTEVSTQIFLKNNHLDEDQNGVLCDEPGNRNPSLTINSDRDRQRTELCALTGSGLGVGFPRPGGYLPSSGTVRAVMLFVEFPTVKIDEDIAAEAVRYTEQFIEFMYRQSRGKQQWEFTVPPEVFLINRDPREYGADFTSSTFALPRFDLYLQDAVNAADSRVDFSDFDVVYVIPPRKIGNVISYGPASPRMPEGYVSSDEGSIYAAATAGNDSRLGRNSEPWEWLAHETGHLYGLSHPLNENGRFDEFGRELSPLERTELWDLMSWLRSPSPDLWGWSRWWIGWLDDDAIYCVSPDSLDTGVELYLNLSDGKPLEKETLLAVIVTGNDQALVIEARKPNRLPFTGDEVRVLAYLVNVNQGDQDGQIQPISANDERFEGFLDGSLSAGDSVAVADLTVNFLREGVNGAFVSVSR